MDWEQYRKLLDLPFDDNQRYLKCENIILNELELYFDFVSYRVAMNPIIATFDYKNFCNTLGIRISS